MHEALIKITPALLETLTPEELRKVAAAFDVTVKELLGCSRPLYIGQSGPDLCDLSLEERAALTPEQLADFEARDEACRQRIAAWGAKLEERRFIRTIAEQAADILAARQRGKPLPLRAELAEFIRTRREQRATVDAADKAVGQLESRLNAVVEILESDPKRSGPIDLRDITPQNIRDALAILGRVPANRTGRAFKDVPLRRLAEMQHGAKLYADTNLEKFRDALKMFFSHRFTEAGISLPNPAAVAQVAVNAGRKGDTREAFSPEQIKIHFSVDMLERLPISRGQTKKFEPHRFWLPLICAYSGMRPGEVAQLFRDDIELVDDVLCFRVRANEARGQRLKTSNAVRNVPIHSTLIAVDLLKFLDQLASDEPLFSELVPDEHGNRWTSTAINGYRLRLSAAGIVPEPNQKLGAHSWRHTVKSFLIHSAQIPAPTANVLLGHAADDSGTVAAYSGHASTAALRSAVEAITHGGVSVTLLREHARLYGPGAAKNPARRRPKPDA